LVVKVLLNADDVDNVDLNRFLLKLDTIRFIYYLCKSALSASSAFKATLLFKAGLSSWLAFAMFSYPTEIFPLLLLSVTCLSKIESGVKLSFRLPRWFYGVIILSLTIVLFQVWRDTTGLKRITSKNLMKNITK
jgi:hypothetical protein